MRTRHVRKLASSLLGLIVVGCLWFYFAPVALGGSTTYVVTSGISMEPRFHTGDLAVVRSKSSYHVGEIVAYHNKMLGTLVLHRIIGREGDRYLFKGDNNNFVDFEHPLASQLVGALWLHIPGAGAKLKSLNSPVLVGVLVAIGMLLLTGAAFTKRRRRTRRQARAGQGSPAPPGVPSRSRIPSPSTGLMQHPSETVLAALALGLLALLPFLALALLAFTRAPTARLPYDIPYKQTGSLSYSANAAPGPTYEGDRVNTGEPLFTRVVRTVQLRFGYRFDTADAHSLTGSASLAATITSTSGWHTSLALGPTTRFHGDRALATGTLDLSSLVALIRSVDHTTAVSGSYTLTIVPHVNTTGTVDSMPMHTTFAPAMQFTLTELEAQPVIGTSSSAPAAQALANLFAPSASGSVTGTRSRPLYLSLILGRMPVATARTIALGGIGAIVGVLVMMLAFARPRRRDETAAIIARYGGLIVQVAHVSQPPGTSVIDVADMESLARIAGHYDRSILHECSADGDAFWVTDESGQFRYAISAQAASAAEPVSTAEMHGTAEMVTRAAVWEDPGIAATTATWAAPAPANDVAASRIVTNDLAASGATANPASASGTAEYQPEPYELVPEPTPSETEAVPRRLSGRYAPI